MTQRVEVELGERSYTIVIGNGITDEITAFVRSLRMRMSVRSVQSRLRQLLERAA